MNDNVLKTIDKYAMLRPGGRVAVALSGGADSVALLHFFCGLREAWGLTLCALHLNHMLRGDESERDEAFVRGLCAEWQVELTVETRSVAELSAQAGLSLEETGRRERYAFFERAAPPGFVIATAHSLSDSVETMLLQLVRGTGLDGLKGIPPVRGRIIRPLISTTRAEVEAYCLENRLNFVTDSSNLSTNFTRNRIRKQVVPVLRSVNPALERTAEATMRLLAGDAAYLEELAARELSRLRLAAPEGDAAIDRTEYLALPAPIASRVLIILLRERELPYSRARVELLHRQILSGGGGVQLSREWELCVGRDAFLFAALRTVADFFCTRVSRGELGADWECEVVPGKSVRVVTTECKQIEKFLQNNKKVLKNLLDYDKISFMTEFRQRMPGDRIALTGRGCTKSLRKLFGEAALTPWQRSRVLVLADDRGKPIWVEGFGTGESAAPGESTTRVAEIVVMEE